MFRKLKLVGGFAIIASLVLAGCGGGAAASAAQTGSELRTLTVTGSAQIPLTPDVAYIQIGVHTQADEVAAAVSTNTTQVASVMAALRGMGVAEKDLQTSNFSIYQSEQWAPDGSSFGTVYVVDNTIFVTIRALDQMGQMLQAAIEAGANNIYGIQFDVADKSAALSQGRAMAVAAAEAQATELAAAAGVRLDDIRSISYYSGSYASPYYGLGGGGGGAAQEISISAGQLTITVDVTVVYDITP